MIISEITVSHGRTINTDNYESARVDVTMTAVVIEGENPKDVYTKLSDLVKHRVDEECREIFDVKIRDRMAKF